MKSILLVLLFVIPVTFQTLNSAAYIAQPATIQTYSQPAEECTYWITKSSGKRHNSKCRYYKNSKGYCTEDGTKGKACKICGG